MKIFSKHRKKLDAHRRYGSREFKEKLNVAKNHKRSLNKTVKAFNLNFFGKTGLSQAGTITGLILLGVIFYFLVISQYFLVRDVSVSGNKLVSTQEIDSLVNQSGRFFLVPQNSLFLLSQSRIQSSAAKTLPMIKEVKVTRTWPNKLSIKVTERVPALVLISHDKNFLVDDQGFVIKELVGPTNEFKVLDQVDEDVTVGQTIGGKLVPFVLSMQKIWPEKLNIPIVSAKVPGKGAAEVEFASSEGWSVFFSTDRPVPSQVSNLAILLNKQISSADRPKLAYIDLRLAKWAYYCFKNTPCQQTDQDNLAAQAAPATTSGAATTPNPTPPVDNSIQPKSPGSTTVNPVIK